MSTPHYILLFASWAFSIFRFFRRLGPWGLLILSALDSSFLVLPFGNDLLLIAFVSADTARFNSLLYVLMSALGSVLGVLLVDIPMRKAGEEGLRRFVRPKSIGRLKAKMENGGWAIIIATLVPPPFPFTPVMMAASALQYPRRKLLSAVFVGRLVRFGLEAILAIYFGRKILAFINSRVLEYFVYLLIIIALAGSVLSVMKWLTRSKSKTLEQFSRR